MPIRLAKELVLGFFPEGFDGIEGAGEEQTMQEEIPAEKLCTKHSRKQLRILSDL